MAQPTINPNGFIVSAMKYLADSFNGSEFIYVKGIGQQLSVAKQFCIDGFTMESNPLNENPTFNNQGITITLKIKFLDIVNLKENNLEVSYLDSFLRKLNDINKQNTTKYSPIYISGFSSNNADGEETALYYTIDLSFKFFYNVS